MTKGVKKSKSVRDRQDKQINKHQKTNDNFDGVQVSINSDEELDYEDDLQEDEEVGSIDQDDR